MEQEDIKQQYDTSHFNHTIEQAKERIASVEELIVDLNNCKSSYSKKALYAILSKLMVNVQNFASD